MATLIVFSALPASGKPSIARALAQEIGAICLRIGSIEQAIRQSGVVPGSLDDAGYRAAYPVAEDNLLWGAMSYPWILTRDASRRNKSEAPQRRQLGPLIRVLGRLSAGGSGPGAAVPFGARSYQ